MIGFEMTEVMEGYHSIPSYSDKRLPMSFTAKWGTEDVESFLDSSSKNYLMCPMRGTLTAEGLCDKAALRGYLNLNYPNGTLKYEFSFRTPDGVLYLFEGEKVNIKPWNLPVSHTTCYTTIVNDLDQLVSRGVVFFKLKNAFSFIKSLKISRT